MVPSIVVLCGRRSNSRDPPPLPHAAPHVARLMIADRATPTIQYCPICLGRGATAHSRRGWRSALDVVCSIDGCFLRDSCWRCGGLLSPLLLTVPCRELLCVACGASLAKAPSLRMDATTSDQLMLDCGIAHRAVLLSSDVVSVRGKDSIGHARPAAFAGPIQPILPIATSRSCCKPRDGPGKSHAPRTDVPREPGRAFACRRRQRHPPWRRLRPPPRPADGRRYQGTRKG